MNKPTTKVPGTDVSHQSPGLFPESLIVISVLLTISNPEVSSNFSERAMSVTTSWVNNLLSAIKHTNTYKYFVLILNIELTLLF